MTSESRPIWPQRISYHAVRGPRSLERIQTKNKIFLGDPALLLPQIWPGATVLTKKILLVPHFVTFQYFNDKYLSILPKDWGILNLLSSPREICEKISGSEFIISNSLHGLIVADAYGVPSCRIHPYGPIKGDGFKFIDYEEQRGKLLNVPYYMEDILNGKINLKDEAFSPCRPSASTIEGLISSFPMK
ncbi:polysaccharide pyruvyl transferase family protein [Pleomorphomonas carboxyditropha]